jgi:hypothetical protein
MISVSRVTSFRKIGYLRIGVQFASSWIGTYNSVGYDSRCNIVQSSLVPIFDPKSFDSVANMQELGRELSKTIGGSATAIQLRADIQSMKKESQFSSQLGSLESMDSFLQDWLQVLFCVDNLALKQITFDSTGSVLECIAREDTVHSVKTISELKKRFINGRRCFALFHPLMPNHPVAFIHVGLTSGLANSLK